MLLRLLTAGALSAVCLAASAADESHAHAGHAMQGSITITQPWSRAMPPSAPTGAVYFQLQNQGRPMIAWSVPRRRAPSVPSCICTSTKAM